MWFRSTPRKMGFTDPLPEPLAFPAQMEPRPGIEPDHPRYQREAQDHCAGHGGKRRARSAGRYRLEPLSRRSQRPGCFTSQISQGGRRTIPAFSDPTMTLRSWSPILAEGWCTRSPCPFGHHRVSNARPAPADLTFHFGGQRVHSKPRPRGPIPLQTGAGALAGSLSILAESWSNRSPYLAVPTGFQPVPGARLVNSP